MYQEQDIINIARVLGITFDKFSFKDLMTGIKIELEHGLVDPSTNVTNDDLVLTMKIALAHLNEFPDYYNQEYGLPALERYLSTKKPQC